MDFTEKQAFYSTLSKDDRSVIFDVVNTVFLKLTGSQKHMIKKSFVHVWKVNKTVGCFELMMALYHSIAKLDKAETLVSDDINSGHVCHDWAIQTVPWRRYRGICLTLQEEIEELTDKLENDGPVEQISKAEHYDDMKEQKQRLTQKYEDKIKELERELVRQKFTNDKEMRLDALDAKRQAFLDKQQKALAKIKDAGMNMPVAEQPAPLEPLANNS
tara:strand:- start:10 stop:657 length:648 start_codon:yes stop_codon:yes gene_type:complete